MCRNIKPLFNFNPPASEEEIQNASIQFLKKISGLKITSKINEDAFEIAVLEISDTLSKLLSTLKTNSKPKNREIEAIKSKERNDLRFYNSK